ncbi:MAG TPA: hypothetical protein VGN57_09570 [Pirellulaceae bacterium]|jgi:hypothetical protein|nr:hypothetical protein [Pirellulaceae bacterium]
MEREDDHDPYRSPGLDSAEDVAAPTPRRERPSAGKVALVTLLLAVGVPLAAIVLLFAVCTAFVAFA